MDNWKLPDRKRHPPRGASPLEERLRALEEQVAEHRTHADAAPAAPEQHYWKPGMQGPEAPSVARLATISEDLDAHRDQLRNAEMSLVDKIADVDDERRRATVRLQKAWQTYRDEVDDRLRRHTRITAALLVFFALLVGSALFYAARHIGIAQMKMTAEFAEVKETLNRVPTPPPQSDSQTSELKDLSARLDALSDTVATLSETRQRTEQIPAPDADAQLAADARLAAEIEQLEARQQLAAQELVSLRQALDTAQETVDEQQTAETGAAADPGATDTADNNSASSAVAADDGGEDAEDANSAEPTSGIGEDAAPPSRVEQETVSISDAPYGLQLVSFRSRNSLMRFAAQQGLPPRIYYRQETYRGRPWFVMIHSLHESTEAAAAELAGLPAGLAEQVDPWIRTLDEGSELTVLEVPATD